MCHLCCREGIVVLHPRESNRRRISFFSQNFKDTEKEKFPRLRGTQPLAFQGKWILDGSTLTFDHISGDSNGAVRLKRNPFCDPHSQPLLLLSPKIHTQPNRKGPSSLPSKSYPLGEKIKRLRPLESKWTPQGHTVSLEEMREKGKKIVDVANLHRKTQMESQVFISQLASNSSRLPCTGSSKFPYSQVV